MEASNDKHEYPPVLLLIHRRENSMVEFFEFEQILGARRSIFFKDLS